MTKLLQWIVRIAGIVALLLGMSFWAGPGIAPVGVHMAFGSLVALALAILAITALIKSVRTPVAAVALLWAIATLAVGGMQYTRAKGSPDLILEIVHLLLGVGAIGLGEMLAAAFNRARPA